MAFNQIEIDGITYFYRKMMIKESTIEMWKREVRLDYALMEICKWCHKEITEPCEMYLIINNNKSFPNCWIHEECFESWPVDVIINELKNEYQEAKPYEHWFR